MFVNKYIANATGKQLKNSEDAEFEILRMLFPYVH